MAFFFGFLCPWCNFGLNLRRTLKLNAVVQTLIAFFFSVVCVFAVHQTINAICPIPDVIPPAEGFDDDEPNPLCVKGIGTFFSRAACFEVHSDCYNLQYARYAAPFIMFWFYCYVAYRRSQVRYLHSLPGWWLKDLCWEQFCCLCTLCQETRTYWFYNVQDGEWLGQVYKSREGIYMDDPYDV